MIELKNVSKQFLLKEGVVEALSDISLAVQDGEIVGIVGYSGAGKSTLLRLLNGLAVPTSGEVIVDGINPHTLSRRAKIAYCQKFGMIFQHFHLLWSRTVKENIALALEIAKVPKHEQEVRVVELLKLVGLSLKGDQYPATLSGGEKQRVGIARALANRPRYLLCDEATSALDPENTRAILDLLQDVRKKLGVTIVFITHQMEVIQALADRVVVMQDGRIVEENALLPLLLQPKHSVTRRFVKSIVDPGDFVAWDQSIVYRLSYVDTLSAKPLISEMIHAYQVEVNILQGKIARVGSSAYGTLYVTIQGPQTQEALNYLSNQGVKVVIQDGSME